MRILILLEHRAVLDKRMERASHRMVSRSAAEKHHNQTGSETWTAITWNDQA